VTNISMGLNAAMTSMKFLVGWSVGSIALVADGVHSLSDLVTDLVVIVGTWIGGRPADKRHPYGHGRIETISAVIIGLTLAAVGAQIAYVAGREMYLRHHAFPGSWVLVIASISVVGKEWLYRITRRVAMRCNSAATYANAWHHRSDALSSVAVVGGSVAGVMGWGHGDQVAGILVGIMVISVGLKVTMDATMELFDQSADPETVQALEAIIAEQVEVRGYHRLRSRLVGREIFVDVHILVDPALSVVQGHAVADKVEDSVRASMRRPANIVVHIEPDLPALRTINPNK
jgi:cation diffusion facilitator family transporter